MEIVHQATVVVTGELMLADLIQEAHRAGVPQSARVDVHQEPRTQDPRDPGGRKTITFHWITT